MPTLLSQWPTKMAVDAGSNLSLSCQIDEPSGAYSIVWHKDNHDIAANRYTQAVLNGKCITELCIIWFRDISQVIFFQVLTNI